MSAFQNLSRSSEALHVFRLILTSHINSPEVLRVNFLRESSAMTCQVSVSLTYMTYGPVSFVLNDLGLWPKLFQLA